MLATNQSALQLLESLSYRIEQRIAVAYENVAQTSLILIVCFSYGYTMVTQLC